MYLKAWRFRSGSVSVVALDLLLWLESSRYLLFILVNNYCWSQPDFLPWSTPADDAYTSTPWFTRSGRPSMNPNWPFKTHSPSTQIDLWTLNSPNEHLWPNSPLKFCLFYCNPFPVIHPFFIANLWRALAYIYCSRWCSTSNRHNRGNFVIYIIVHLPIVVPFRLPILTHSVHKPVEQYCWLFYGWGFRTRNSSSNGTERSPKFSSTSWAWKFQTF